MTASVTDGGRRTRSKTLADLGEFGLIARLRRLGAVGGAVETGIGDDCAVVRVGGRRLLITTDALVEDVHFRLGWDSFAGLGRRAFAVNASDIAAMGGVPRFALVALTLPSSANVDDAEQLERGIARAAGVVGCAIVGGNLTAGRAWTITISVIGEATGAPLLRSGARPGDLICVGGPLGGAAYGREVLLGRRPGKRGDAMRFLRPPSRLELGAWLSRTGSASAAIDVSDGLTADLAHLCRASRVGADITADRIPTPPVLRRLLAAERLRLALAGGEDYELLFTVPPDRAARLDREANRRAWPIARIGRVTARRGVRVEDASADVTGGFDHFR